MYCYWLNSANAPKPLHVHDEQSILVDAKRFLDNGWEIHTNGCGHPGVPATPSDPGYRAPVIVDLVEVSNA